MCSTSWWARPVFCAWPKPGVISGKHESVVLRGWEPAKEESGAPPLPSSPCRKLCGSLLGCHPRWDAASRTNRGGMTSLSSAPSQWNAVNKGCLHVIVLVNLNTANTKDVQGLRETVQQNIRAESLISKHLTNILLISLKSSSENTQWTPAAFFLKSWIVIKITVALFKEFEVCFLRLKCVQSIPISPRWIKTSPRDWEHWMTFAFHNVSSSIASFTSAFSLTVTPPQPVPVTQSKVTNRLGQGIDLGLGIIQQKGSAISFSHGLHHCEAHAVVTVGGKRQRSVLRERLISFSLVFFLLVTYRAHFSGCKLHQFKSSIVEAFHIASAQSFQY